MEIVLVLGKWLSCVLFENAAYLWIHRQEWVFNQKWWLLALLQRSEDWLQLLLPGWIQPEARQENLWRWEKKSDIITLTSVYFKRTLWPALGHGCVQNIANKLDLVWKNSFLIGHLFLYLQTLMNVMCRTLAVRSASTCLAATSATVRRVMRLTLWARHARLRQVRFDRKTALFLSFLLDSWVCMTYRFVILSPLSSSSLSSRHYTHSVLHQQTRGEEVDSGPQRLRPSDPSAEKSSGSGHRHAK